MHSAYSQTGIHKAESEIQLCPTLSRGKIKSVDWDSRQRIRRT